MRWSKFVPKRAGGIAGISGVAAIAVVSFTAAPARAVLRLDLKAANYNEAAGTWADASGNADTATYVVNKPTLSATGQTPNGSKVVHFADVDTSAYAQSQFLRLASAIGSGSNAYTVIAYLRPSSFERQVAQGTVVGSHVNHTTAPDGGGNYTAAGDVATAGFQYRLDDPSSPTPPQIALKRGVRFLGNSTSSVPSSNFSLVAVSFDGSNASTANLAFYLNGNPDGTAVAGATSFEFGISTIGAADFKTDASNTTYNPNEFFSGDIAELQVYDTALTSAQIASASSAITSAFVPEPAGLALVAAGAWGLSRRRRARSARSHGSSD